MSVAPARSRRQPGNQPSQQLPQRPRVKAEFASSQKLSGLGERIVGALPGGAAVKRPAAPLEPSGSETESSGRRHRAGDETEPSTTRSRVPQAADPGPAPAPAPAPIEVDEPPLVRQSPPKASPQRPAFQRENSFVQPPFQPPIQRENSVVSPESLQREGESFLRHFMAFGQVNQDLQAQLDAKEREISAMKGEISAMSEAFDQQEARLRNFDAMAEEAREKSEAAREQALLDLEQRLRKDQEKRFGEMEQQAVESNKFLQKVAAERDKALAQVESLEERMEVLGERKENAKQRAFDMELQLVRQRLERESEGRRVAEAQNAASHKRILELEAELRASQSQARRNKRESLELQEASQFQKELAEDLEHQMRQKEKDMQYQLLQERGRLEAVQRLEGVLPKHLIMKALMR